MITGERNNFNQLPRKFIDESSRLLTYDVMAFNG
jgi:hypothetical protein